MDRGGRRGAGAPFYVPLRRKTSAEIISEARAAIYGGKFAGRLYIKLVKLKL